MPRPTQYDRDAAEFGIDAPLTVELVQRRLSYDLSQARQLLRYLVGQGLSGWYLFVGMGSDFDPLDDEDVLTFSSSKLAAH